MTPGDALVLDALALASHLDLHGGAIIRDMRQSAQDIGVISLIEQALARASDDEQRSELIAALALLTAPPATERSR